MVAHTAVNLLLFNWFMITSSAVAAAATASVARTQRPARRKEASSSALRLPECSDLTAMAPPANNTECHC